MTLEQLKDEIEAIAKSFPEFESFDFGDEFMQDAYVGTEYPLLFLEMPFNLDYNFTSTKQKTIKFGLQLLFKKGENNKADLTILSKAERLGDFISQRIHALKNFKIDSCIAATILEHSDDDVLGVLMEITGRTTKACEKC